MTDEMYLRYFQEYENDPDLYLDKEKFAPYVFSEEKVMQYIGRQRDLNRVTLAIMYDDEMAGEILIKNIRAKECATLGISLKNDKYKNRGIGTGAERLAVQYVFHELEIPVLYADTIKTNARSQRVLEKAGFSRIREEDDLIYYEIRRDREKIIDIVGDNYFGSWEKMRIACRGIIIREGKILLSYETKTGVWMIPGGGQEPGESEEMCCTREVSEETGFCIHVSPCVLEIDEYYEDWKYVSRYFWGTVAGQCERELTEREALVGMEPRWIQTDKAIEIFSHHAEYADIDEMRRGMYLREYTALCSLLK